MANKINNYSKKYGITGGIANAIVSIIKAEIDCNNCLDIATVGERPENVNFAMYFDSDEPSSAVSGDIWVDIDNGSFYIYNGTTWDTGFRWDFENGITNVSGDVKLGGLLSEDTSISGTTYDFDMVNADATAPGTFNFTRSFTGDKDFNISLTTESGFDLALIRRRDLTNPLDYKALSVGDSSAALISSPNITSTMVQVYASDAVGGISYIDQGNSANNAYVKAASGEVQLEAASVQIRSTELTTDETTTFNFIPDTLTTLNIGADTTAVNIGKKGATTTAKGLLTVDTGLTVVGNIKVVSLPTYADNAAAGALSVGDLYIANGSGVNIQGTLMVKY